MSIGHTGHHATDGVLHTATCNHVVQFYDSEEFLNDAVAGFLAEGLVAGQPLVIVATPDRRLAVENRLFTHGFDLQRAEQMGMLSFLDAEETLGAIMRDGMPDEQSFRRVIGSVMEQALEGRARVRVRAYGEMVDVLWQGGNRDAAIRLEELWNGLADRYVFELLCAYGMSSFDRAEDAVGIAEVLRRHSRVIPADGWSHTLDEDRRSREIVLLQQRARALEAEIEQRKELEIALRQALEARRVSEESLRQAKDEAERASRVKSEFLAVMSHELRTPLNAIIGYHDLLEQGVGGALAETQRVYLSRLRNGAEQLTALIDQVLSLSRIEAGKEDVRRERVDLAALLAETCQLMEPAAAQKGLALLLRPMPADVTIETDGAKVRQVLLNLLSNAVKFTSGGSVALGVASGVGDVRIVVADSGIGIAASELERIFEPFVQVDGSSTRTRGGTGLGLSVSRHLARLLGGDVVATSEPGRGSIFTLRLPREPAPTA